MVIETGGLQYPIRVDDQFSATIQKFIQLIEEAKASASGFGGADIKGLKAFADSFKALSQSGSTAAKTISEVGAANKAATQSAEANAEAIDSVTQASKDASAIIDRRIRQANAEIALNISGAQSAKQLAEAKREEAAARKQAFDAAEQERKSLAKPIAVTDTDASQSKNFAKTRAAEIAEEQAAQQKAVSETIALDKAIGKERLAALEQNEKEIVQARTTIDNVFQAERAAQAEKGLAQEQAQIAEEGQLERLRLQQAKESNAALLAAQEESDAKRSAALKAGIQQRAALEAENLKLAQASAAAIKRNFLEQQAEQQKALQATPQFQASQAVAAAQQRLAVLEQTLVQGRAAGAPQGFLNKTEQQIKSLRGEVDATDGSVNRISFTFRRLFGILAAFTVARKLFEGFTGIVKEAIDFNAQLEQSQLSIAALAISAGQVRDAQGNLVEGAEAFAAAQKVSAQQMKLLREDSLRTAASFEDLAFAFQTAIGPGFAAGLNLDEIRKFSVDISRAATAIGLPQRQLAEEIRSILQGTIRVQQTRIAAVLNITNDDIRRAKEQGTLVSFLADKFKAFDQAAEAGANNFTIILQRLKNAFQLVVGTAGSGLFNDLKTSLKGVLDQLVTIPEQGAPIVNPKAVEILNAIFSSLQRIFNLGVDIAKSFTFEDAKKTIESIGSALEVGATILFSLLKGVLQAIKDIQLALAPVIAFFGTQFGQVLGKGLAQVVRLSVFLAGIGFIVKGLLSPFTLTLSLITSITKQVQTLNTSLLTASTTAGKLGQIISGIGITALATGILSALEKADEKATDLVKTLSGNEQADPTIVDKLKVAFNSLDTVAGASLNKVRAEIRSLFNKQDVPSLDQFLNDELFGRTINQFQEVSNKFVKPIEVAPGSLADLLTNLPTSLTGSRKAIEEQSDLGQRLRDELRDARLELAGTERGFAAEGIALQINQEILRGEVELAKQKKNLQIEINDLTAKAKTLEEARKDTQQEIAKTGTQEADLIKRLTAEVEKQVEAEKNLKEAKAQGLGTDALEAEIAARKKDFETILPANLKPKADEIRRLITDTLNQRAEGFSLQNRINEATNDESKLQHDIFEVVKERVEKIAVQELKQTRDQNEELELQVKAQERLLKARATSFSNITDQPIRTQLAEAQNELETRQLQNSRALETSRANLALLEQSRADILNRLGKTGVDASHIDEQITEERRKQNALLEEQATLIDDLITRAERLSKAGKDFGEQINLGLEAAMAQFAEQAPDTFQTVFHAFTTLFDGFVDIGKQAFASVFDPNANFNLKEAFGRLLLQVATDIFGDTLKQIIGDFFKQLLSELIAKQAAQQAATSLLSAFGFGFAMGGIVPHFGPKAMGMAAGRPRHIPASDTIPAWLTPGEWVIRAESVRKAGFDVMDGINRGRFNPSVLRAAVSAPSDRAKQALPATLSFASGGGVPSQSSSGSAGPGTSVIPAVMVNEQSMKLLLKAGEGTLKRWLRDEGFSNRR